MKTLHKNIRFLCKNLGLFFLFFGILPFQVLYKVQLQHDNKGATNGEV